MSKEVNEITGSILDAAVKLHIRVGPGLFESVYEALLAQELERRGFKVARQYPVTFDLDGIHFDDGFRADLLVDNVVVVELKSLEKLAAVHSKQLLTYLRLLNLRIGLLINFGAPVLKDGVRRIVNDYPPICRTINKLLS